MPRTQESLQALRCVTPSVGQLPRRLCDRLGSIYTLAPGPSFLQTKRSKSEEALRACLLSVRLLETRGGEAGRGAVLFCPARLCVDATAAEVYQAQERGVLRVC